MPAGEEILRDFGISLETELERNIAENEEFLEGLFYGEKRSGHPEGETGWHVRDVLHNIDRWFSDDPDRERLRIAALVHDSFKGKEGKNHGEAAREFLSGYTEDEVLLNLVFIHDKPYKAFKDRNKPVLWKRLSDITDSMGPHLGLLVKFYKCDNSVTGKKPEDCEWFLQCLKKVE